MVIRKTEALLYFLAIFIVFFIAIPCLAQQNAVIGNNQDQDPNQSKSQEVGEGDAGEQPAELPPRYQPDLDKKKQRLILDAFTEEQVQRFRLSGELVTLEANNQPFLAVWEKNRGPTPLGALLLLHGEGQTLDSPEAIGRIRSSLPDHGWATLSVSIDQMPSKVIPRRVVVDSLSKGSTQVDGEETAEQGAGQKANAEATDPVSEKDGDESLDDKQSKKITAPKNNESQDKSMVDVDVMALIQSKDEKYMQNTLARLRAGLRFLNDKGQFNVAVVSHGRGAIYIKMLAQEFQSAAPAADADQAISTTIRALIFVNARNKSVSNMHDLESMFVDDDLPTLDVYFNDHILDQIEPKMRIKAAKRASHKNYYQVRLKRPSSNWHAGENRLTRRVRGFLNRFAKGVEIGG